MRNGRIRGFKKGAASFYVVAFSTLILLIIAASFAAVIISEITRTSNDDLAQSAYDSALAGIEDAKLAYNNYRNCVDSGGVAANSMTLNCGTIMYYMENEAVQDCDMVGHMLGRTAIGEEGAVMITETSSGNGNNMAQAYTCVKIESPSDYRATLSSSMPSKLVPVVLDGTAAKDIKSVKISWTIDTGQDLSYTYYNNGTVTFPNIGAIGSGSPPVIALTMVQTGGEKFNFSDFNKTIDGKTNRGTIYLVPARAKNGTENFINSQGFAKSNDKTVKNLPYVVYCSDSDGEEFVCSATVQLPEPIGGDRNDDTFLFVVSLPYGGPSTKFAMDFCTKKEGCISEGVVIEDGEQKEKIARADITSQIEIDSTGRANDLYRRVKARIDLVDITMAYPLYAIQLLGDGNDSLADKSFNWVTTEWGIENVDNAYDGH